MFNRYIQSCTDFKCPYSRRPSVKALNPLNRPNAIFVLAVDRISRNLLIYLIGR
jgi:hypothetical protein